MKLHLQPASCSRSPLHVPPLEGAQVESCVHELPQLIEVGGLVPCCRSSCRVPSHIPETNIKGLWHWDVWAPDSLTGLFKCACVLNKSDNKGRETLTKWVSCWPPLWGNVAWRNHSNPCSCAPPDTRSAQRWHIFLSLLWPGQTGMERSEGEAAD